jgi:hypothetical protein
LTESANSCAGARYIGGLGIAYAAAGKRSEASKILGDLQELSKRRYIPPTSAANILAHMGRKGEAFEELERGYEDRSWIMVSMKAAPVVDPFRSDPRFQALLRRMNLPEKQQTCAHASGLGAGRHLGSSRGGEVL